jgi:isopenicillin-N N-acyltransferase-like protein
MNAGHRPIHVVELEGTSRARGYQHGRALHEPIALAVDFYRVFFAKHLGLEWATVRERARPFVEATAALSPKLVAEYEGIAEGSGQRLEDLVALTARYEITYSAIALGDCSNVYAGPERTDSGHTLLAQSWEWRPEVMDFRAVLVARCDDVPDHIVVTECGQPGKYGLNADGIGVVAAGLYANDKTSVGDQLCVALAREMLAQSSFADACRVIERHPPRATVNMMVAAAGGGAADYEATGAKLSRRDLGAGETYWHTNHCLQSTEPCGFDNSLIRGRRWAALLDSPVPVTACGMQRWLADRSDGSDSICVLADPALAGAATWLQTLSSVVLDLDAREFSFSDGPSCLAPFRSLRL